MKIHKRLATLLLALTLCFGFTATAYAHDVPDMDRTGSISARMLYDGKAVGGFEAVSPFLVSVPMFENGSYVYDVNAEPKLSALTKNHVTDPGTSGGGSSSGGSSSGSGSSGAAGTLPQTGQLNWPIPVLSAAGLCLFFLGWMLRYSRQRKAYEA